MLRKVFNWTNVIGTAFIFLTMWLFYLVGVQLDFLNAFAEVFKDFQLTDKYYSIPYYEPNTPPKLREESLNHRYYDSATQAINQQIVLVNVGWLNRAQTAAQVGALARCKPKVIAIDVEYPLKDYSLMSPVDSFRIRFQTQAFADTLAAYRNEVPIILASRIDTAGKKSIRPKKSHFEVDSLLMPDPLLRAHAHTGFVTVLSEGTGKYRTWREIPTLALKGKHREVSLGVAAIEHYDRQKYERFLKRGNAKEIINWRGNEGHFPKLDAENVLNNQFMPEFIEGKIVLMGYLGASFDQQSAADDDLYYTPMNYSQVGRSEPDIYGVVGHANVASMIIAEDYVDVSPQWFNLMVAVLLGFFNVAVFYMVNYNRRLALWYNAISKAVILVETVLLSMVMFFSVGYFSYKVDLTLSILVVVLSADVAEIYMDAILPTYRRFARKINQQGKTKANA